MSDATDKGLEFCSKVQIIKASRSLGAWYNTMVGDVFEVRPQYFYGGGYKWITREEGIIDPEDCEEITESRYNQIKNLEQRVTALEEKIKSLNL